MNTKLDEENEEEEEEDMVDQRTSVDIKQQFYAL